MIIDRQINLCISTEKPRHRTYFTQPLNLPVCYPRRLFLSLMITVRTAKNYFSGDMDINNIKMNQLCRSDCLSPQDCCAMIVQDSPVRCSSRKKGDPRTTFECSSVSSSVSVSHFHYMEIDHMKGITSPNAHHFELKLKFWLNT